MSTLRRYTKSKSQPCYILDYTQKGKRHQKYLHCDIETARKIKKRIDAEISLGRFGIEAPPEIKLKELYQEFYQQKSNEGLRSSTLDIYNLAFKDLVSKLGNITPRALNNRLISSFQRSLLDKYSVVTSNIRIRHIKAFLNWLYANHHITELFLIKETKTDEQLPEFISPEQFKSILDNTIDPILQSSFITLYNTGMRRGEIGDAELDGDYIRIRKTKGNRERFIKISDKLKEHFNIYKDDGYTPWWTSRSFSKAKTKAGLGKNITLHSLRHSFALKTLAATGDIYMVKSLLGHSTVRTTEIYLKFPLDYLKRFYHIATNVQ